MNRRGFLKSLVATIATATVVNASHEENEQVLDIEPEYDKDKHLSELKADYKLADKVIGFYDRELMKAMQEKTLFGEFAKAGKIS